MRLSPPGHQIDGDSYRLHINGIGTGMLTGDQADGQSASLAATARNQQP